MWWIILVLTSLFALLLYSYLIKPHNHWKKLNIPFVKPWPIIGNMAPFLFRQKCMAEWLQDIYNAYDDRHRYLGLYTFLTPTLMIKDLNLIKQISIKDFDQFPERRSFISEETDPLLGKNLSSLTGQRWRHMRSTLSPVFTGNKMRAMFVLMCKCAEQFVDYFSKQVDSRKPLTIEMQEVFARFTNDVIATTAFGIECDSLNDENNEFFVMGKGTMNIAQARNLRFFLYNISAPLMKLFNVKLFSDEVCNFFRNIVVNNIKAREEQGIVRPDLIHLLMEARKGKLRHEEASKKSDVSSDGFATAEESSVDKDFKEALTELSDDEITAQALIFFIAGFTTTSTQMSHMAYELALNEDVQRKLQEEIDVTLTKCNGKITYEDLMQMKYLDMVVSESLRKWPVALVLDRVCAGSYTIPAENPNEQPLKLEKDDLVWFPVFAIHRDPNYFPDPDKFDPERFSDENRGNIPAHSYMPFGTGPRNCIASRFALVETKTIFFYMLAKFSLVIVDKSEVPLRISKTKFDVTAENGFWLGLKLRN